MQKTSDVWNSGCKIKKVNMVKAGCSLVFKNKIIMVSTHKFCQLDYCVLN
jgi:hypothetical protein